MMSKTIESYIVPKIRFTGVTHYICTDEDCENARFSVREELWFMPYCPYCGSYEHVQLEGELYSDGIL